MQKFTRSDYEGNSYPAVYTRSDSRLTVWVGKNPVQLIRELYVHLPAPFYLLYVLVVPRSVAEPGRYESCVSLDRPQVDAFLNRYQDFLEQDGRHNFWICSVDGTARIVYDRHEILYLYGNLNALEQVLRESGLRCGEAQEIGEHFHFYHPEFDDQQLAIVQGSEFRWTPLQQQDEN